MERLIFSIFACLLATNVLALEVTAEPSVISNDQRPIVKVTTSLPPKTMLMGTITSPLNQGGTGYVGQAQATVSANQVAQFGPFSKGGGKLLSGDYQFRLDTAMTSLQPAEVQTVFGTRGAKLTGKLISVLSGFDENGVTYTFKFSINPDGAVKLVNQSSPDDEVWEIFKDATKQIRVLTNGFFYDRKNYSGTGFRTNVVYDLPESDIVGSPQSVEYFIEGYCEDKIYSILSTTFFSGKGCTVEKGCSGFPIKTLSADGLKRKLISGSAFEKAFKSLCQIAQSK